VRGAAEGQVPELRVRERSGITFCGECGQHLAESPSRAPLPKPRTYTPKYLAERILAEQAAMESRGAQDGERKTITALFADIQGSVELIEEMDPRKPDRSSIRRCRS